MSNTKNHILKNIFIVISLLIITTIVFGFVGNSTNAGLIQDGDDIANLIEYSQNKDTWYNFDASKEIGVKVKSGIEGGEAPYDQVGGMCIQPNNHYFYGTTYKVVNIFDINNNTSSNTVKVYSEDNKEGVEYPVADENVKPILMLAYLARIAEENGEENATQNSSAKDAMARITWEDTYVNQMRQVGLSDYIEGQGLGYTGSNDYIEAAETYADEAQKQAKLETAALEISMEKSEIDSITTTTINGKTFIGPYRINLTGGAQVGEITINNSEKAVGISETIDTNAIKNVDAVQHHKPFYVVVNDSATKVEDIKIKSKNSLVSTKARLLIVSGGASQNFIIYNAEQIDTNLEKSLPTPKLGKLEIQKVDEYKDSTISLKDIEFKVFAKDKGWVSNEGDTIKIYEGLKNYYDDVKPFKTDANGKITIENLPAGKYYIYETGLPEELEEIYTLEETMVPRHNQKVKAKLVAQENKDGTKTSEFTISSGQTATVTAVNSRAYTDVYVHKVDKDTQKPLNGYEFRLYRVDGDNSGWVKAENNVVLEKDRYTKDFDDKQVAKLVTVNGVSQKLTGLPSGTYELYETKLGENGEGYDLGKFEKDGKEHDGKLIDTQEVTTSTNGEFKFEETNAQDFIKISGKIWEEELEGKNLQTNQEIEYSDNDKLVEGIEVILFDNKTKEQRKTYTNEKGEYSFENVRIRESANPDTTDYLKNYAIIFRYDGFIFEGVISSEKEIVKYNANGTINENSSKAYENQDSRKILNNLFDNVTGEGQQLSNNVQLRYNKSETGVTLDNTAKLTETDNSVKVEGRSDFLVTAYARGNLLQEYFDKLKTTEDVVKEISNINLGIYQREDPDLTLQTDIYSTEVKVNGQKYTYRYDGMAKDPKQTVTAVQYDSKYTYYPLYEADVEAYPNDPNRSLHATAIYKVALRNDSRNLYTTVNGIEEWYSKNYSLAKENGEYAIYLSNDKNEREFNESNRVKIKGDAQQVDRSSENSNYLRSTLEFENPIQLAATSTNDPIEKYLFIKLDINDIKDIYNNRDAVKLENFAEIRSYTTYSDPEYKNLFAGIDSTSIPQNLNADKFIETDEDDSDKARGLKIIDAGERKLSGTVFVDEDADGKVGANQERKGNGILDDNEKARVSGVKVQLIEVNGNQEKEYTTTTTEDGNFTFSGFLPGTYKVVYTWGDDKYNVEDYKGTIYVAPGDWFTNKTRYSDAMDNYDTRIAIDQYALYNRGTKVEKMESTTPAFAIGIERADYEELPGDVGEKTEKDGTKYIFNSENVDFGIIERPRQAMEINKDLKSIKLTAADGSTLVNAEIQDDNTLKAITGEKYVSGGGDLDYIWVQVDKDITQSMKAEMGYNITVSNVSEIDYDSKDYYVYGKQTGPASTMKLKAEEVYDYCKGAALASSNDTTVWETVTPGDYKINTTTKETITDANFTEQYNKIVDENGNIRENYSWENSYSKTREIYEEWLEQMAQTKTTDVKNVKLADREIMKYIGDKLTKALAPGQSETAEIKTSKLISNGDEIRFDNDAEITHIEYTTDQKTGRKPSANTSKIYDRGGWTTITPATGEDRDYTWIIITAVSAIAVLGVGIVIIKKKVLK